jgi:hypothetical protein
VAVLLSTLCRVDIAAVIAGLGTVFDADEAAIAERLLREYGGTIPDKQLIDEIGLAVAIHRRKPST